MFFSIANRLEWTTGPPQTKNVSASNSNLLAKTPVNEELLHDITKYIEHLSQQYPAEAKVEFKRPLQYVSSTLKPALLAGDGHKLSSSATLPR
jgi:hypothetical protein